MDSCVGCTNMKQGRIKSYSCGHKLKKKKRISNIPLWNDMNVHRVYMVALIGEFIAGLKCFTSE